MNVPKLRFPEFSGEWEEKKLKECVDIFDSQREPLDAKERANRSGKYPYYGASGIIDYIDDYIFEGEAVLLGEDGANIINRNSRLAFIATGKYWVNNHVHIMKANSDNVNYYICEYLENLNYSKICAGTAQPKLTQDVIRNLTIRTPCKQEQQKIAGFLSNVDSIISAETKILNTLQKKKKALMQKLFTQQIRFKSNDGTDFPEWEEKKLGELCEYIGGGTPSKKCKEYWNGNINWASVKDITGKYLFETQDKITQLGVDSSATNICGPNSLLLITRMSPGKTVITKCITAINQDLKIVKSEINTEFLHLLFESIQSKIDEKTSGTTVKGISIESLNQIVVKLPCKVEQQKIVDCLSSMDSLIQNQQKVVTTWQQRKKALLQQMFI